nr:MAG TPA: hypothetical protein [Caudoviricetes sp.]
MAQGWPLGSPLVLPGVDKVAQGRSKPEPKIYYIHARQSLTLNAANCPHGGVRATKGGVGWPSGWLYV